MPRIVIIKADLSVSKFHIEAEVQNRHRKQLIWCILALVALPLLVQSDPTDEPPANANTTVHDGRTIILRRSDGKLNFYQSWHTYLNQFGSDTAEYWAGLNSVSALTASGTCDLLVELTAFDGAVARAQYTHFQVGEAEDSYRLSVSGFKDQGAGDGLTFHHGAMFSTYDRDNDGNPDVHCARANAGAFWFHKDECLNANPTGIYMWGPYDTTEPIGVMWTPFKGSKTSLKTMTMSVACK
ncbi:microfibril-associated glycoprotein 4-like [Polymixia lowei]